MCVYIYISFSLSTYYLPTYLSIYLSICLSVYLSICLSIYLAIYSSYLAVYLSIYLSIHLSIYLFPSLSLCLCLCLCLSLSLSLSLFFNSSTSKSCPNVVFFHILTATFQYLAIAQIALKICFGQPSLLANRFLCFVSRQPVLLLLRWFLLTPASPCSLLVVRIRDRMNMAESAGRSLATSLRSVHICTSVQTLGFVLPELVKEKHPWPSL